MGLFYFFDCGTLSIRTSDAAIGCPLIIDKNGTRKYVYNW